ncbi:hypothetical protein GE09DRAFT_1143067 [Coniochaeta sp. 2T2.1]|nr:hypothetical protein GE09DRAFT_1143067 [Coniochaeta sp. 2T2.1]
MVPPVDEPEPLGWSWTVFLGVLCWSLIVFWPEEDILDILDERVGLKTGEGYLDLVFELDCGLMIVLLWFGMLLFLV